MTNKYEDIIDLPHHVSRTHPHMSIYDRSAQFAPFAALTGHDAAIQETARLTQQRIELDENSRAFLDETLQKIRIKLAEKPMVEITYFVEDERKSGGSYHTVKGTVKKVDEYSQCMLLNTAEDEEEWISMKEIILLELL